MLASIIDKQTPAARAAGSWAGVLARSVPRRAGVRGQHVRRRDARPARSTAARWYRAFWSGEEQTRVQVGFEVCGRCQRPAAPVLRPPGLHGAADRDRFLAMKTAVLHEAGVLSPTEPRIDW